TRSTERQTTTTQTATPSGSQTSTAGQTTTTGDQTQQTTTTTTTTPQTTAPAATTTTQDTTASTIPQRNDEGSPYRHGEIGVQANYLRLANFHDLNTLGVGANLDFNVNRHLQFESQMAYNFERNTT